MSAASASPTEVAISDQGTRRPAPSHGLPERLPILRAANRFVVGPDQLHAAALEDPLRVKRRSEIQGRLPAERRQ